jgi:hypothetical protein
MSSGAKIVIQRVPCYDVPALGNVTELCDMTRFLQTLGMCLKGFM